MDQNLERKSVQNKWFWGLLNIQHQILAKIVSRTGQFSSLDIPK
jgi:hypothetical protein